MVLGDAVSKLETFVWILKHISRFIVSVHPRNIKLGQMTNLNMIFHVVTWCQIIDWLKFETCPRSLLNFGMANKPFSLQQNIV